MASTITCVHLLNDTGAVADKVTKASNNLGRQAMLTRLISSRGSRVLDKSLWFLESHLEGPNIRQTIRRLSG